MPHFLDGKRGRLPQTPFLHVRLAPIIERRPGNHQLVKGHSVDRKRAKIRLQLNPFRKVPSIG